MERRTGSSRINGLSLSALPGHGSNSYFCLFVFLYFCLFYKWTQLIRCLLDLDPTHTQSSVSSSSSPPGKRISSLKSAMDYWIVSLFPCLNSWSGFESNYKSVGFSTQSTISFQPKAKSCLRYFPLLDLDSFDSEFINTYGQRKTEGKQIRKVIKSFALPSNYPWSLLLH